MAEDAGIGMGFLQATEQAQQGAFLAGRYGMGTDKLFVACLVGSAVAGDVVVVARESESFRVTADECCHGKVLVRARGRTVYDNQINRPHDCTKNELMIAVSTVMANWMMFFQRFMLLIICIVFSG